MGVVGLGSGLGLGGDICVELHLACDALSVLWRQSGAVHVHVHVRVYVHVSVRVSYALIGKALRCAGKHCSIAALQHCSIAALQHCSIAALQHCSIAALQHCSIAALQHCSIAALQHCSIAALQHCSTAVIYDAGSGFWGGRGFFGGPETGQFVGVSRFTKYNTSGRQYLLYQGHLHRQRHFVSAPMGWTTRLFCGVF